MSNKVFLSFVWALVMTLGCWAADIPPASVHVYANGAIELADQGAGVTGLHPTWGSEEHRAKTLCLYKTGTPGEWHNFEFTVRAVEEVSMRLTLRGESLTIDGQKQPFVIYYDDVCIDGKPVKNGDFEAGMPDKSQGYLCQDPAIVSSGKACGAAWANSTITFPIGRRQAGEKVNIRLRFMPGGSVDILDNMFPLDLRAAANMGYSDPVAFDGKGGWSDQGPDKDFADFDTRRRDFGGVAFDLIDPQLNGGKAILTFDSEHAATGLKTAELTPKNDKTEGKYLYLLHASAWTPADAALGAILVHYANGKEQTIEVRSGRDLVDWQNFSGAPNGKLVYRRNLPCPGSLSLSRFELTGQSPVKGMTVTGSGNSVWMLLGATVTNQNVILLQADFIPGKEWKKADFAAREIVPGSALDLTALHHTPAGLFGKVVISNGRFEFEQRPGVQARFHSYQGRILDQLFDKWQKTLTFEDVKLAKQRAVTLAGAMARQGYNAQRDMEYMTILSHGADEDCTFRPEKLEVYDFLSAELQKNGIYTLLCLGSERMGYVDYHAAWHQRAGRKLPLLLGDPVWRARWKKCAETILNHVNPYTGVALKDSPALIGVELFNEETMEIMRTGQLRSCPEPYLGMLRQSYRDDLAATYGDIGALNRVWGTQYSSFADIDVPGKTADITPDWTRFVNHRMLAAQTWGISTLRELGYRGPVTNNNFNASLDLAAVRAEGVDFTTFNTYFAHPDAQGNVMQNSSIGDGLYHIALLADVKLRNRPMFVTEYNFSMPNPYVHENGVTMSAYAALQGYDGLSAHEGAVWIASGFSRDQYINAFDIGLSPVARAAEFMTSCFFLRGDVAKSPSEISYLVSREVLDSGVMGRFAISRPMLRLSLIIGAGMEIEGLRNAGKFPAVPPAAAVLRPSGFSDFQVSEFFARQLDSEDKTFDPAKTVEEWRRLGILPAGNRTDVAKGIYESVTGEFLFRLDGMARVITPRSEAVVLKANQSESLKVLEVKRTSVPAAVGLFAVDGNVLTESGRMVLIYSTEMVPEGMVLSPNRNVIKQKGNLSALLLTGKLSASFALAAERQYELYALSVNGQRRERIDLTNINGKWELSLDTATLSNGPTVFFELVAPGNSANNIK